ncbi:hypothetical protein GF389_02625 [Candidatus Dojkabacteria bacterium]|nr:hypothetical protein [Candidatus Dojkabacteria bacterium]
MQKSTVRFLAILFTFSLFLPIANTKAYDITVDQQNTTISGSSVTIANYGHNQTFTPEYDVLTSLQVYLKDRRGGHNIDLTVMDETAGQTVLTKSQRMSSGTGWEVFDFVDDAIGYKITPGNLHSVWIETDYFSEAPIPSWVRSSNDTYSGGIRRQNTTDYPDDDFAFATFGYLTDQGGEDLQQDSETDPINNNQDQQENENDSSDQNQNSSNDGLDNDGDQDSQEERPAKKPDPTIILEKVVVGETIYDVPLAGELFVEHTSTLTVTGSANADSLLKITIGDNSYDVLTNTNGDWSLSPDISGLLKDNAYEIKASYEDSKLETKLLEFSVYDESSQFLSKGESESKKSTSTVIKIIIFTALCIAALAISFAVLYIVFGDDMREYYLKCTRPYISKMRNGKKGTSDTYKTSE